MTATQITLDLTGNASAKAFVAAVKSGERKAQTYVDTNGVTADNLAEHVAALTLLAYPKAKPDGRADKGTPGYAAHNFRNAIRGALKRCLDKPTTVESETDYLAKVLKAIDAGVTHNLNAADILKAVTAHVDGLLA